MDERHKRKGKESRRGAVAIFCATGSVGRDLCQDRKKGDDMGFATKTRSRLQVSVAWGELGTGGRDWQMRAVWSKLFQA